MELARRAGQPCGTCAAEMCAHELLVAVILGFRDDPCCPACLARLQGRDPEALVRDVALHARRRDCFGAAWAWASANEGACRLDAFEPSEGFEAEVIQPGAELLPDTEWDAGDMACGDLVLELRARLRALPPGSVLLVTADDPGAPEDLPAWCRMTGHRLVYARAPLFAIRAKEE